MRVSRTIAVAWIIAGGLVLAAGAGTVRGQCSANELAKLTSDAAATNDQFGRSVSIDRGVAVIGVPSGGIGSSEPGSAYIYRFDPLIETWIAETELVSSDGAGGDNFGHASSVSGNVVLVGAYLNDGGANSSGAAYVFRYDPITKTWSQEAKLVASDAAGGDRFGFSVSISGNVALVGADLNDDAGSSSGSAYVFRYDPLSETWNEETKLTASDAAAGDAYGFSVAIHGDTALVGSEHDDDFGEDSGAGYVYRYDPIGETWDEEAKLTASDAQADDQLGRSVAIRGDLALLGAWKDDNAGTNSGSAYVFRYDPINETWDEEDKLTASDAAADDQFGRSVSIDGDTAVVGSWNDDDGGTDSGSVYTFRYDSTTETWGEAAKLTASDAAAYDGFGFSVSLSGPVLMIGSRYDDHSGISNAGSVYVFRGLGDCNTNGTLDLCDLAAGTSQDTNGNGVPDGCEQLGDCNHDLVVDLLDYEAFEVCHLGPQAGLSAGCECVDLEQDGDVDLADFRLFQTLFTVGPP